MKTKTKPKKKKSQKTKKRRQNKTFSTTQKVQGKYSFLNKIYLQILCITKVR